jgi:hypothetical protein
MGGSFSQKDMVAEEVLAIFPQPMPGQTEAQFCALAEKHEQERCEQTRQELLSFLKLIKSIAFLKNKDHQLAFEELLGAVREAGLAVVAAIPCLSSMVCSYHKHNALPDDIVKSWVTFKAVLNHSRRSIIKLIRSVIFYQKAECPLCRNQFAL